MSMALSRLGKGNGPGRGSPGGSPQPMSPPARAKRRGTRRDASCEPLRAPGSRPAGWRRRRDWACARARAPPRSRSRAARSSSACYARPRSPSMLCYTIRYYTILYYILYHTIPYHTILYYAMLCYTILYYTICYYTMLYYTKAALPRMQSRGLSSILWAFATLRHSPGRLQRQREMTRTSGKSNAYHDFTLYALSIRHVNGKRNASTMATISATKTRSPPASGPSWSLTRARPCAAWTASSLWSWRSDAPGPGAERMHKSMIQISIYTSDPEEPGRFLHAAERKRPGARRAPLHVASRPRGGGSWSGGRRMSGPGKHALGTRQARLRARRGLPPGAPGEVPEGPRPLRRRGRHAGDAGE